MSNSLDHRTSALVNEAGVNFQNVTQPDAASGGRLLSTSEEHKRIRMAKPTGRCLWFIFAIALTLLILIAVSVIVAVTVSKGNSEDEKILYKPNKVPHLHVRCSHDVMVAQNDLHDHWQHYNSKAHIWKTIPKIKDVGFVLMSPRYKLEAGYPGVMISMLLPRGNSHFHFMAVTNKDHHSHPVSVATSDSRCETVVLDDPNFFDGNEKEFRIYVYFKNRIFLKGMKFTVTSLLLVTKFESLTIRKKVSTQPEFVYVDAGHRDDCSIEIKNSERHCNWWNVLDRDNANFVPSRSSRDGCIDGGVNSVAGAIWFLTLESGDDMHESRALLASPIIQRTTGSLLLTLWYRFKCEGPHLRIHLVPAEKHSFSRALSTSTMVANVTIPAPHDDWKFLSFKINLPATSKSYHIILEGTVPRKSNCTLHNCFSEKTSQAEPAKLAQLGIDSLSIELMHQQCKPANKSNVMDCRFQTDANEPTTCGWESSFPKGISREMIKHLPELLDWKTVNSGDGIHHGATAQHFEGRGYIMTFDASGRANSESYVRTPLLRANNNCSCFMTFFYLIRGLLAPRMQVNIVYAPDTNDGSQLSAPQWSLFGHQGEDWKTATIALNLKTGRPFQIEIRVLDIYFTGGDVHFDDLFFSACDMDKHTSE